MFRRATLFRLRADFISTLMQRGQLADMMLFQHFSSIFTSVPGKAVAGATRENEKSKGDSTAPESLKGEFLEKCEMVRTRAAQTPNVTAWFTNDNTAREWTALSHSRESVRATPAEGSDGGRMLLNGSLVVIGGEAQRPPNVKLIASKKDNDTEPLLLLLPFTSREGSVRVNALTNGLLRVELDSAEAFVVASGRSAVDEFTAEQNVLFAAACSGMICRLQEICALHATHASQYDALLIRNQAVQKSLSQMACSQYAVEALQSFVVGCVGNRDESPSLGEAKEAKAMAKDAKSDSRLPLVETIALYMHAKWALTCAVRQCREILCFLPRGMEQKAVPHRSRPDRLIDYTYAQQLLYDEQHILMGLAIGSGAQLEHHIVPLLAESNVTPNMGHSRGDKVSALARHVINSSSNRPRITAAHPYLRLSSDELERDVGDFIQLLGGRQREKTSDATFSLMATQYASEIFASVAVLYRATAALGREGGAPRDWLIAQALCEDSKLRRAQLLRNYKLASAVQRQRSTDPLRTTHPVELLNNVFI
ncbi:hypothetical protein ERJ75_000746000 [Trypanosoma vivax]|uniref:Uncharacterized protein n=1 Tax=Trypanosoma vivax (strain Y486) TaxID=1055687 RepID=G0U0A9_TRYVY|nr:hypothetical protein TRVL_04314 [Trypanosoma vivax]KAH8613867.1 hypothetical protein ERJ75_000746000 [Trypanosoma vivax]CCC49507.1 conserved hypothetical protein [Trypanosoma vivax Y486]